jgi:hypothetical protein
MKWKSGEQAQLRDLTPPPHGSIAVCDNHVTVARRGFWHPHENVFFDDANHLLGGGCPGSVACSPLVTRAAKLLSRDFREAQSVDRSLRGRRVITTRD